MGIITPISQQTMTEGFKPMGQPKKIRIVSVFIRLGLHLPNAHNYFNKLERIKTDSPLCETVFGTRKMIFLNKN